jgi:hypothetical protein
MADEKKDKQYDLEPQEPDAGPAPQAPPPPASEEPPSIKALDVCPNCGSPLGGVDTVVCLRCGFDFKSLRVIKTETGEPVSPEPDEAEAPVLSRPGTGGFWAPWVMVAGGLLLLAIGYLWGWAGLFPGEEAVGYGARMVGLLKMLLKTAVLALSGLGALCAVAHMVSARLGDVKLAAVRMLGIAAVIGLLSFFNAPNDALEWTIESISQALAFLGLSMVLFRLSARDAATLLGATVVAVVGLLLASALVLWAVMPGG